MRGQDIVERLRLILPLYTDRASSRLDIADMSVTGQDVTVTTVGDHGLSMGQTVNITGTKVRVAILSFSYDATTGKLTIKTNSDHDVKLYKQVVSIVIDGAADASLNGTFVVSDVPDRFTICVHVADTPLDLNPFGAVIVSDRIDGFNGLQQVSSVVSSDQFTYTLSSAPAGVPDFSSASVVVATFIYNVISIAEAERLITPSSSWFVFVIVGDANANRSRKTLTDMSNQNGRHADQRLILIRSVSIVVVYDSESAKTNLGGGAIRDQMETMAVALIGSLQSWSPPSQLSSSVASSPLSLVSHSVLDYTGPQYKHIFRFESAEDVFADDLFMPQDRALLDIGLDMKNRFNTVISSTSVNLDEVK